MEPNTLLTAHRPVMLAEVLQALQPRPGGRYIDATLGGGGHAEAVLVSSAPDGRLLGLDLDGQAVARSRARLARFVDRAVCVQAGSDRLHDMAAAHGFLGCDGILLDLGLSSDQLADVERGFSFQHDAPLDMRFDTSQGPSAAELVNELPEAELADLIYEYGEERRSRAVARAIVQNRPLHRTAQLATIVQRVVGRGAQGIHPATRTFMALRIAVNDELGRLARALPQTMEALAPGGRLVVISFHSLEDRLVKTFMQREATDCICPPEVPVCVCGHVAKLRLLHRKPLLPQAEEVSENPRARSAKLRAAERI